jgi:uncharacterized protein YutE (UPF0331/DUF86 family)
MRIGEKIKEIEQFLIELEDILPHDYDRYDLKTKAACERYFEKIVEASVDLAFLIIKEHRFAMPEGYSQAFEILWSEGVISQQLCRRLQMAKGMRNIISHQYGNVDDLLVYHAITDELILDIEEFLKYIIKNCKHG